MEIGLSPNFDITGTKWYHKTGKDSFVVREVIMDPSQGMIVLAEDGRTFSMDAMDNYIQTNEPFNAPQYNTTQRRCRPEDVNIWMVPKVRSW